MSSSMWAWRVIIPGLALAVCTLILWQSVRGETPNVPNPSTVAMPPKPRVIAEGRIAARPGALILVGTEVGGTIAAVSAPEKARVRKGDALIELRPDALKLDLAEAEARLLEADAEVGYAQREYERRSKSPIEPTKYQSELDDARRTSEVATARRKALQMAVERGKLALSRARISSPIDGVVLTCPARVGEIVAPGSRLASVCDLSRVWIVAEIDEFDAPRISQGDEVVITAEGYDQASWRGKVEEIPDQVAERSVRPEDPGRPTDTRVLLVKIGLNQPLPLKLGQQVEVEIRPIKP